MNELCSDWHAPYTVSIAPYSLSRGKPAEVYFTSEHSFMDLRCATSLRTDECDIIYVCKYIQFKFTSRTLQCTMNGIRSLQTGIMEEYPVMSTSQGTCVRIEQTSEVIRVTYEMCRAVGRGGLELRTAAVRCSGVLKKGLKHWILNRFLLVNLKKKKNTSRCWCLSTKQ